MPSWMRPPGRGQPNESTNDTGPATGHVEMAPEPVTGNEPPPPCGGSPDLLLRLLGLELLIQVVHGRLQIGETGVHGRPLRLQQGGRLRLRVGLLGQPRALTAETLGLDRHRRRQVLVALHDVLGEPQPVREVRERLGAEQRSDGLVAAGDVDGPHLRIEPPLELGELRLEGADLLLGLARRILRLGVRGLRLLPLQGERVELRLLRGELLTSRIQVALGVGVRGDGDEHAREGGDGDDDAQGHAGDDQPQDVCLLVRRPERYADGCAEATSGLVSSSTRPERGGYARGPWKSTLPPCRERWSGSARTSRPTSRR